MALAQMLAGYSLGQADLLRRAMGKKKKEILDKEFVPFRDGMPGATATPTRRSRRSGTCWSRSPTTPSTRRTPPAYGLVSYWTGVPQGELPGRVHGRRCSPASATTRTSWRSTWPSAAAWASRCCRRTSTSPPAPFTPVGKDIRFGLAAVRNVGANVVDAIIRCRKEKGEYADFHDFLRKVDAVVCNKRTIESLIKAGAFDSMGHTRKGLLAVHAEAIDAVRRRQAQRGRSASSTSSARVRRRRRPAARHSAMPRRSRRRVGQARPARLRAGDARPVRLRPPAVRPGARPRRRRPTRTIAALTEEGTVPDGAVVTLAGILSGVQRRITKQGKAWASATLEDLGRRGRGAVLPEHLRA